MPRLEYFLAARSVSVDQRSDRVSVFDIVEQLRPREFPFLIPSLVFVSSWGFEPSDAGKDFQVGIKISNTSIDPNETHNANFTAAAKDVNQRIFIQAVGTTVTAPGRITIELLLNGDGHAHHFITVAAADSSVPEDGFILYPQKPPEHAKQPAQEAPAA